MGYGSLRAGDPPDFEIVKPEDFCSSRSKLPAGFYWWPVRAEHDVLGAHYRGLGEPRGPFASYEAAAHAAHATIGAERAADGRAAERYARRAADSAVSEAFAPADHGYAQDCGALAHLTPDALHALVSGAVAASVAAALRAHRERD